MGGKNKKAFRELFVVLTTNISLLYYIKHVLYAILDSLEFEVLCLFLAPVLSLKVNVDIGEGMCIKF